ncbi:RHS repeat-associated protein [Actinomadura pelletieri DSM 43383]|uniref:RHS repeat-associated protein n=1 Tax=Actinomadura pelletieri DSM 43383 TaxID=1120940 RepID=A0A495QG43_9ACTN|nr:RHS repeat-associated protein [Actinomadura pelletieri DSM 43383]
MPWGETGTALYAEKKETNVFRKPATWVAVSALTVSGFAPPATADTVADAPRAHQFQRLYPEIGSPNAANPRLGPSKRGGVRLVSPGTVADASKTRIPARAPSGTRTPRTAALASVPVGIGPVRNGTFLSFNLADYLQLKVNTGSGNAMVRTTDMSLPGVGGNVTVGAAYNSLLHAADAPTGVVSPGWRTRLGQDVRLYENSDDSVTFTGPDGVSGVFTPSGSGYTSPKEFKGDLVTQSGGGWKYTDHGSGQRHYFDSSGLPTKLEDRNGNVTDFGYTSGNISTITYKPKGETTGRQIKVGSYGDRLTRYAQDKAGGGRRIAVYTYDGADRLQRIQEPAGEVMSFGYDGSGRLNSISNGKGAVTELVYDGDHRVLSVTRVGSTNRQVTRLAYPSDTETQVADPNTDQSKPVEDVPHTTYTLNSNDRVTKTVDPAGKTRSKTYTPFSDVASYENANQGMTSNTFGANGGESPTRSASPTGATSSLTYGNSPTDQNPTAAYQPSAGSDTQGNASAYTYDGPGNLSSAKNALAAEAKLAYNDDGTVKESTDPGNGTNSTTYSYDDGHQLKSVTPPTGNSLGRKSFTYDGYGRLDTVTDGNGKKTGYTYDDNDRVLTIAYSDGTPSVTYTYDRAGNVRTRTDATGTTTWTYTQRNLLGGRHSTSGGGEITWQYDATGNLVDQLNDAGTLHYVHSVRNLLASMTDYAGRTWEFDHDDDGNRTDTYFNRTSSTAWAMHTRNTYDGSGRITRIVTSRAGDDGKKISDVSYCYSKRGSATSCDTGKSNDSGLRQWSKDNLTGTISDYTYDKGNRLTKATNVAGHTYEYRYDERGNRTSVTRDGTETQRLTFNSANQVTTGGETYDAAGNRTAGNGLEGTYNAARQTTRFTRGTSTIPYAYAGPGQAEMTSAKGLSVVYGRSAGTSGGIVSYTYGSTTFWMIHDSGGTPLGYLDDGKPHAFGSDGLGSVTSIVSQAGTREAAYTYGPYGETTADDGPQSALNLMRYTGGLHEPASGLLKLGDRFYDQGRGRFTQQDVVNAIGDPRTGNRYAYAGDNPINNLDPTGHFYEQFKIDVCYFACVGVGVATGDGGTRPIGSVGLGLDVGVGGSATANTGQVQSGLTVGGSCSAPGLTAASEISMTGEAGASAGVTTGTEYGCALEETFTM